MLKKRYGPKSNDTEYNSNDDDAGLRQKVSIKPVAHSFSPSEGESSSRRIPTSYFTFVPAGTFASTLSNDGSPSIESAMIMPLDSFPISFDCVRFATMMMLWPIFTY